MPRGLVHDGEACSCEPGTPAIFSPIGDRFLCAGCLAPCDAARVSDDVPWPVPIHARAYGIAARSALMDGSGRALGIAGLLSLGQRLVFVRCACGCSRLEVTSPVQVAGA